MVSATTMSLSPQGGAPGAGILSPQERVSGLKTCGDSQYTTPVDINEIPVEKQP